MKPTLLLFFVACVFWCSIATAVELTFLTPDGKPAAGTKFYQNFREPGHGAGMGMEMMMGGYDDMGMDGGMDEMYGSGMEMGMGGMGSTPLPAGDGLAFLNGEPLQIMSPPIGEQALSGDNGKIEVTRERLRRNRGVSMHAVSALAVHESGFSFIPAGTRVSSTVKLRFGGKIVLTPPEGVDATQHQVLTCWQNGFAYPSLEQYKQELGMSQNIGKQLDPDDWRFSPRFRWYQTSDLGDTISVPPGEVRVTIVPRQPGAKPLTESNADQLFELLTSGGPSTIVLVSGKTSKPTTVEFAAVRSLNLRVPKKSDDALPNWGDERPGRYYLERFNRHSYGDTSTLSQPSDQDISSGSTVAKFLNQKRDERAAYQERRLPTSFDNQVVRFDLLRPGWYVVIKPIEGDVSVRGIPITNWEHGDGVTTAVLADGKIKGVEGVFELSVSDQGVTTFRSNGSPQGVADQAASTRRSDIEKLKLVRTLRRDIEATVARLAKHRKQLMEIEATLQQKVSPVGPTADPFGGPDTMKDPFGGGADSPNNDPFGGPSGGADPFGADPFGGNPNSVDPFDGGGGVVVQEDPFG